MRPTEAWRRTQVVKGADCKSVMRRFESGRRLHNFIYLRTVIGTTVPIGADFVPTRSLSAVCASFAAVSRRRARKRSWNVCWWAARSEFVGLSEPGSRKAGEADAKNLAVL